MPSGKKSLWPFTSISSKSGNQEFELTDVFSSRAFIAQRFLAYLCGCVVKADVAWQGSNKVFVMEMSNQAHNSGLFPKCRSSLFWLSFLTGILLPKEKALELINCTQRLGLCRFSLGKNHSSYIFLHYLPSLAVNNICTSSFAVKIKNSMCFCHRCIAFKLMLFSTAVSSVIYLSPVSIIINLKCT